MTTAARVRTANGARFYTRDGEPCFEIPKKSGQGMKAPTIADAREMGLLPSVTSIIRLLDKPELNTWLTEQSVLAVLSTPRHKGEELDAFVHRVLQVEKVQDQQAAHARQLGTDIHQALHLALSDQHWDRTLAPFVIPVIKWRMGVGGVCWTEKVLVGNGYAGRADALLDDEILNALYLVDFKSAGKLPKDSYPEHKLQTAAYAATLGNTNGRRIITSNVYISTAEPGQFVVHSQYDWQETYARGFVPLVHYWSWANKYAPWKND